MSAPVDLPRLVVAAPASGAGKTTVATGLMAALAGAGRHVSGHKVGPDYIDPGYHALATGRPGRNLDPCLAGADRVAPLLRHGATGAEVSVVEGVMGLYDGAAAAELASTAQVAKLLAAPVVLVVDAAAQGRSVAALIHGFASYDPEVRLAGVILNRVGSARHEMILREAVASVGLPVLGALARRDEAAVPSRHLGLVPAAERHAGAEETVRWLGGLVARDCDVEGLLALARSAPPLATERWDPAGAVAEEEGEGGGLPGGAGPGPGTPDGNPRGPRVAVAGGAAFTFGYPETVELLEAAGARVEGVDPLCDEALPAGTEGLVLGGGFPEIHAGELSANAGLRREVAALAAAGAPVVAECAGLLYLARSLDGQPMCGVLDVDATMTGELTLGYRDAVAVSDSCLTRAGERVTGHEFHRTAVLPAAGAHPAWQWSVDGPEGHVRRAVHASYLHLHWAGAPHLARRFVEACG